MQIPAKRPARRLSLVGETSDISAHANFGGTAPFHGDRVELQQQHWRRCRRRNLLLPRELIGQPK